MARKAMTGWMLVGTGIGIAAAIVGTRTMKAQSKKGLKNNMNGLKSEAVSMIKDGLSGNAAQMAKKTGDVLIKAATNLDNGAKN
ncbi:MAG: hypothetical protein PHN47_07635 [Clostridia bacterium]|jgi:hypothetical protein|nr:hypothetical protein [Clostridia bacterium]